MELFTLLILILCTGCMAEYNVTVPDSKKYALPGQNATFVYTISADPHDGNPNFIRLKIQTSEDSESVLFGFTWKDGNWTMKQQNVDEGRKLARYRGRVSIEYTKPNLILHLRNITDADFGWIYQGEALSFKYASPFQGDIKLIKAEKPQIFESSSCFPEMWVKRGADSDCICRAKGVPPANVKWVRGDTLLSRGYEKAVLKFYSAKKENTDNYACIASNIGGTDIEKMSLVVAYIEYGSGAVPPTSKRVSVSRRGLFEERCNVVGNPSPTYKWKDPNNLVVRSDAKIAIGNINKLQFGNYTCIAENYAGTLEYRVQVEEKKEIPIIADTLFFPRATAGLGTNVEYVCSASGVPPPKIKWFGKNEVVEGEELKLTAVEKQDAGDYTCVVENEMGVVNRTMTLTISYMEFTDERVSSESINITEGGHTNVLCKVVGVPTPAYSWLSPDGEVVGSVQRLNISDVKLTAKGTYTCKANNGISILKYEMQLNVKALPTTTTTTTTVEVVTNAAASTTKLTTIQIDKGKLTTQPEPVSTVTKVISPRLAVVGDSGSHAAVSTYSVYTMFLLVSIVCLFVQ